MKIEIFTTKDGGGYTVIVDSLFADGLSKDEALGCIASALFGSGRPMFLRSYEENMAWNRRYRGEEFKQEPVALLTTTLGGTQ